MAENDEKKYKNKLYFRITLFIFGTFIAIILMTSLNFEEDCPSYSITNYIKVKGEIYRVTLPILHNISHIYF